MFQKGLGGAAQGAALGSVIPGVGTAIGAGIGGLLGFLGGNDKTPDLPEFKYSAGSLGSTDFADINLKNQDPELYKQIMQNQQLLGDLQQHAAQYREGPTASEKQQTSDYLNQQGSGIASGGMGGSPMANAMMADAASRMQNQAKDRAFQEYTALQGNLNSGMQNQYNMVRGGLNDVANLKNQNMQNSMHRDEFARQQALGQYGEAQKANAASNQFYGGLLSGGLTGLSSMNNMANMSNMMGTSYDPMAGFTGLPSWLSGGSGGGSSPYLGNALPPTAQGAGYNGVGSMNYGNQQPNPWFHY